MYKERAFNKERDSHHVFVDENNNFYYNTLIN